MFSRITVVGAGNVGATAAQRVAEKNLARTVVMVDVVDGVPQGKGLDQWQSAPIEGFDSRVVGSNGYETAVGSELFIVTAGIARKPGMSRDDLVKTNAGIVSSVGKEIARVAPKSIIIVVSNPLDVMCYVAMKASGFPKERVIGMAGVLDTARYRAFLAEAMDVSVEDIQAMVLGGHGDTMVPLVAVVRAVRETSSDRPIAPADPFRALRLVGPAQARVVVFGQDPYPRPGHADGLAFSAGTGRPHSLRRVFEVLEADRPGWPRPGRWALDCWALQGVLLLNPVLTVEVGSAASHMQCGWQALTSQIVVTLCRLNPAPVFLLWGRPAGAFFDAACPVGADPGVLRTRHPSPRHATRVHVRGQPLRRDGRPRRLVGVPA